MLLFSAVFLLPALGLSETLKEKLQTASKVRVDNLRSTIVSLEQFKERSSHAKQNQAVSWVNDEFKKMGIDSWIETYESNGRTWYNGFARIKGQKKPSEMIMVIAHIDSITNQPELGAPGADDNGSGIAALLECARIIKGIPLEKSVQFCIFTNEERGLKGSKAFVQKAKNERLNIQAVINIDALGYDLKITPISWQYIRSNQSLKYKARSAYRITRNILSGITERKNLLLVAGRPQDASLVKIAAGNIREFSELSTREVITSDCG